MSAFSIPPCLIGSFSEGRTDTRRCHTQAYTISLERKTCTKETYRRTKEIFTICFELQSLSALLDMHMMIITSFEGDNLARGLSPQLGRAKSFKAGIMHQHGRSSPNTLEKRSPPQGRSSNNHWGEPLDYHLSTLGKPRAESTRAPHTATFGSILMNCSCTISVILDVRILFFYSAPVFSSSSFFLFFWSSTVAS